MMHFRLARPVTDLRRTEMLYCEGLGLTRLGHFDNHDGFDGVMLGEPGGGYHLEFTYCRTHPVAPSPTEEDLLVFFLPDRQDWLNRCEALLAAGFTPVASLNPYWERDGRTFADHDGYRIVLQAAAWDGGAAVKDPR